MVHNDHITYLYHSLKHWLLHIVLLCSLLSAHAQLTYRELYVEYDSAWSFQQLHIIPIRFTGEGAVKFGKGNELDELITFDQAMATGKLSLKEILYNGGADVGVLVIKNNLKKPVLLLSGSLIAGGKQDRVVAETTIIPPSREDNYINVFCAEKGRWDSKAKPFIESGMADMGLRKKIDLEHRQTAIWNQIESQFHAMGKKAETWPYIQLRHTNEKADSAYQHYFIAKFQQTDSSFAGFAAITGNRIIGCELFASTVQTRLFFKDIISAFIRAIEPTDTLPFLSDHDCRPFFDSLLQSEPSQKQFLKKHGKADSYHGKIMHLIAYGENTNEYL